MTERAARLKAAARELLARLPRCQSGRLFLSPTEGQECPNIATRTAFDYRHSRDVCDECAAKIEAVGDRDFKPELCEPRLEWADAAAKLAAELEEET
jgi:hypothetical protein